MVQSKVIHMLFQSTFPRGERRSLLRDPLDSMHFNPRSHVGNDRLVYPVLRLLPYFNPRSHVGNDNNNSSCLKPFHNFNPRSHVGNDWTGADLYRYIIISIHVPTWGTTTMGGILKSLGFISIHVPTWGTTA